MPIRHRNRRYARREIGDNRTKGTVYHFGRITPEMAVAYIKALKNTKSAFRPKDYLKQLDFFSQFL